MSLKIRLKNLGILKYAEFSLGDLTLICGENNTGKTYAAYTLHGFLQLWRGLIDFGVSDTQIRSLLTDGGIKIGLEGYVEKANQMFVETCDRYTAELDRLVFAAPEGRFRNSEFHIQTETINVRDKEFTHEIGIISARFLAYSKKKGSEDVTVNLVIDKEIGQQIDPDFVIDWTISLICSVFRSSGAVCL